MSWWFQSECLPVLNSEYDRGHLRSSLNHVTFLITYPIFFLSGWLTRKMLTSENQFLLRGASTYTVINSFNRLNLSRIFQNFRFSKIEKYWQSRTPLNRTKSRQLGSLVWKKSAKGSRPKSPKKEFTTKTECSRYCMLEWDRKIFKRRKYFLSFLSSVNYIAKNGLFMRFEKLFVSKRK